MSVLQKINVLSITLLLTATQLLISNNAIIIFCIALLFLCFLLNTKGQNVKGNRKMLSILVLFFAVSVLLTLYNSYFIKNIYSTLLVWSTILLLYFIITTQKDKEIIFLSVFKWFSIITIILIIYGSIIYIFGSKQLVYNSINKCYYQEFSILGHKFIQSAVGDPKYGMFVGSFTGNPNTLSFMCIFSMLYFMVIDDHKAIKKVLSVLICIFGLLISGSRLGLVLMVIMFLLNIVIKKIDFSNKKNIIGILFFFLIIVLLVLFNYDKIYSNIDFNGRTRMWEIGMNNIRLIGNGINTDNIYLYDYLHINTSMHNSYISLYVNYGIIIGSVIMVFLIIVFIRLLKSAHETNINRYIFMLYFSLLIMGLSESVFLIFGFYNSMLFYIINFYYLNDRGK